MFFHNALLVAVSLAFSTFAALPATGEYYIVNQQTGHRFDVSGANSAPGTLVLGYPPNNGLNQRWNVVQVSTEGASGIYTFTAVQPARSVFVNQGNGLTAETYASPINVTEGNAGSTLTYPRSNNPVIAITDSGAGPLTLQPRDATNNLQVWVFQTAA